MTRTQYAKHHSRKALLAKIHIAKKQLGLSDLEYRNVLDNLFAVRSAKSLKIGELSTLLKHFAARGWESGQSRKQASTGWVSIPEGTLYANQKRYILALAQDLGWNLRGLNKRIKTQFGVEHIVFLNRQSDLQTLAKDLVTRCQRAGIDPAPDAY